MDDRPPGHRCSRRPHRLGRVDAAYGALAALVLAAGVTRVVWGAKPADFNLENPVFWFTMAAFAAVGILSIRPTTRHLRWRKALDGDAGALPAAAEISSARRAIHHQLAAFTTIPALAALMARGIGLSDRPTEQTNGGTDMEHALDGWDIGHADDKEWVPWGSTGDAKAKVLATGDGYYVVLVQADPGYTGEAHEHDYTEFSYVLDGEYRTQGRTMHAGDAYAAAPGSVHTDFTTQTGATYLSIFKL